MKPWAEMSVAERGGVFGGVAAVIAALFYGAWTVSRPEAPEAPVGEVAAPVEAEDAAAPASEESAAVEEPATEDDAAQAADAAAAEPTEADADAPELAEEQAPVATEEAAPEATAEAGAGAEAGAEAAAETGIEAEAGADAAPDAMAEAAPEAAAEGAPAVVAVAVAPPSLDLVRVEQDGSALVAGSAQPEADLSLRVTGQEIVAVPADGQGNFVAMFNLAPSPAPRVLSLVMRLPDGTEVPAEGTVVIAPTVAPVALAAAPEGAGTAEGSEAPAAPAAEAPAALLVTEEGARVLQSASDLPQELVANVTIDTITYTPEGAVQLAGRGTPERVVRLYLDNAALAEVAISTAGDWAVTLPEVAPGLYTLRADQVDAAGAVTSRFETPFKRETVEALAAASDAGSGSAVETAEAAPETGAEPAADAASASQADPAATETVAEASGTEPAAPPAPVTVTVQPGFTLWQIATEQLGAGVRYVQVFEANRDQIRDPDLIYPGQVFAIPTAE